LTGKTVQEMEPAARDSVSLSLPQRPNGPSITDFLIDSPKRLENAASPTKQTTEVVSNRMKMTPSQRPITPRAHHPRNVVGP
jgi:hypothetical protein